MPTNEIMFYVIAATALPIQICAAFFCMNRKRGLFVTWSLYALCLAIKFGTNAIPAVRDTVYVHLPMTLWLLIPLFVCFENNAFQKLFLFFSASAVTLTMGLLSQFITQTAFGFGSLGFWYSFALIRLPLLCVIYFLLWKYGRRVSKRLFAMGTRKNWAVYALGPFISFLTLRSFQGSSPPGGEITDATQFLFVMVLSIWSLGILCYAIVSAYRRAEMEYDAQLARQIVSSGSEHYEKMNGMYSALRVLRHDFKYYLSAARKMLRSGDAGEIDKYLSDVEAQLAENDLPGFCTNSVINALLVSYAERCKHLNIKSDFIIHLPDSISIPNYEMCIVIGNLLENAVEACKGHEGVRAIELVINTQGVHLVVKVKNSFNGEIRQDKGQPVSEKAGGGLGLRSVQAVAASYGGELMTEWDSGTFAAYVLMTV